MPPADQWDDIGLAAAAILTAIGGLILAITSWVKNRRELAQVKTQLEPTPPPAPRAIPEVPAAPGTLYDVAAETRALVTTAIQMIAQLAQSDTRIEAWGKEEHARLDQRIDNQCGQLTDHETRLSRLEGDQP